MKTTPEDRERLARLAEAATPGWVAEGAYISAMVPGGRPNGEIIGTCLPSVGRMVDHPQRVANAECAVAARNLALPLLSDLAEVEGENAALRARNEQLARALARAKEQRDSEIRKSYHAKWHGMFETYNAELAAILAEGET